MFKRLAILLAILSIFSSSSAFAEQRAYSFGIPEIKKIGEYTDVTLRDLPLSMEPRMPILPFKPVMILLPPGKTAANIEVFTGKLAEAEGSHLVRPAGNLVPLSFAAESEKRKKAAMLANNGKEPIFRYDIEGTYPEAAFSNFSVQNGRGYKILVVNINPVRYQASTGKIFYATAAVLKYDLVDAQVNKKNTSYVRDIESDRERIAMLVENPEMIKNYSPKKLSGRKVDYLIVTSKSLMSAEGPYSFKAFAGFLSGKGLGVEMAAIEDIVAGNAGRDNAEKLRNFLRKKYNENGLKYVLLGGGGLSQTPVIPVRKLHADFKWESDTFNQELPGDTYYATLDGSYDANNNNIFGEPKDGENGGDVDLLAELSVGRAPVETAKDAENFVRKTMAAYGYFDAPEAGKALFCGESLFPGIYGTSYMGEIENGASTHGFTTTGYPKEYPRASLQDTPNKQWGSADILGAINGGLYIINHIGHSNVTSNMRLSSWNMSKLSNSLFYLLYTQGCYCGRFTDKGCILVSHVNSPYGAYATIGNSSYGLGPEDPDPDTGVVSRGASQYYHRQFTEAAFAGGKNRLGDANQASKEANIKFMYHGTARWVFFELNLFGDPYLPLRVK